MTLPSIRTLHEDGDIVVVDKPAGLATIPERDLAVPNVRRILEAQRGEALFVVHRLDKEVSGLVVFARHEQAHRQLSMAFEARTVKKTYAAIVVGRVEPDEQLVDAPIAQFGSGRMGVRERGGKPSQTVLQVRERSGPLTLVDAEPITGRRHQIRVHAYHVGHPIAGDLRYGDRASQSSFERLFLHARRIAVPMGDAPRVFECPPPEAFERLLRSSRSSAEP